LSSYRLEKGNKFNSGDPIDAKIKYLLKTKQDIEKCTTRTSFNPITKEELEKLDFSDELTKLKTIQREAILEDLSFLLNEKIKELELKEKESNDKELILNDLTNALNEKIDQLEISNKQLQNEKKHSDELNSQLKETLNKLTEAEKQLKIERDWLAKQVEEKSLEVLKTIEQLIKSEKNTQT